MVKHKSINFAFPDSSFPLGIYLDQKKNASTKSALHLHAHSIEFQYIHHGEGAYFINGQLYPFKPRSLYIFQKNDIHALIPGEVASPIKKMTLGFRENIFEAMGYHGSHALSAICAAKEKQFFSMKK